MKPKRYYWIERDGTVVFTGGQSAARSWYRRNSRTSPLRVFYVLRPDQRPSVGDYVSEESGRPLGTQEAHQ